MKSLDINAWEDWLALHNDDLVTFRSYYKYCFIFENKEWKYDIIVGGDADDIYRYSVTNQPTKLKDVRGVEILDIRIYEGSM